MDLKEIKELIALIKKNDLAEFELEQGDFKIKLKKSGGEVQPIVLSAAPAAPVAQIPAAHAHAAAPAATQSAAPANEGNPGKEITSPMVGTFYASSSPEAPPYVSAGQQVTEETVVCIIEAMKVMNEIKAETRGTIAEVLVENGKPVQFGQPLFRLK